MVPPVRIAISSSRAHCIWKANDCIVIYIRGRRSSTGKRYRSEAAIAALRMKLLLLVECFLTRLLQCRGQNGDEGQY
jgi:hypothetical protein